MKECLGSWSDFADLWHASECGELASTHVPMIFHEDAVPHFSGASHVKQVLFRSTLVLKENPNYTMLSYLFPYQVARPRFGHGALDAFAGTRGRINMQLLCWVHLR